MAPKPAASAAEAPGADVLASLPLLVDFQCTPELAAVIRDELEAIRHTTEAERHLERAKETSAGADRESARAHAEVRKAKEKASEEKKRTGEAAAEEASSALASVLALAKSKDLAAQAAAEGYTAAQKALSAARSNSDERASQASDAVSRHYRKQSIKLHPDRNGEHLRPQFESLADAATVLRNGELRQRYVEQMVTVLKQEPELVRMAHRSWLERNGFAEASSAPHDDIDGTDSGTAPKFARLTEGGTGAVPKMAQMLAIEVVSGKPTMDVRFPLGAQPGVYADFRVSWQLRRFQLADDAAASGLVPISQVDWLNACVRTSLDIPSFGTFELRWALDFGRQNESGEPLRSPWSTWLLVLVENPTHAHLMQAREHAERTAEGRLRMLEAAVRSAGAVPTPISTKDAVYHSERLHVGQVRLASAIGRLERLYEEHAKGSADSGLRPRPEDASRVARLSRHAGEVGARATNTSQMFEPILAREKKAEASSRFFRFIRYKLETGLFADWISDTSGSGPTEAVLVSEGGSVNRLYQLLVEGPHRRVGGGGGGGGGGSASAPASNGEHVLEVDSFVLQSATRRDDLFTEKQLKKLGETAVKLEAAERKQEEAERRAEERAEQKRLADEKAAAEAARAEAERRERERKAAEQAAESDARLRVYQSGIKLDCRVMLQGLKGNQHLNGREGTVCSVDDAVVRKGRVVVQLCDTAECAAEQISIRVENVVLMDAELGHGLEDELVGDGGEHGATAGGALEPTPPARAASQHPASAAVAAAEAREPQPPAAPRNRREQQAMTRCRFITSKSGCNNGARCKFSHSLDAPKYPPPIVPSGAPQPQPQPQPHPLPASVPTPAAATDDAALSPAQKKTQEKEKKKKANKKAEPVGGVATTPSPTARSPARQEQPNARSAAAAAHPATSYSSPVGGAPVSSAQAASAEAAEWVTEFDANSGMHYYWNTRTRQTQWQRPEALGPEPGLPQPSTMFAQPAAPNGGAQPKQAAAGRGAAAELEALRAQLEAERIARERAESAYAAAEQIKADERRMCVVCIERPKSHVFDRCFHKCVCDVCAAAIRARPRSQWLCPLCREPCNNIQQVFE